MNHYLPFFKEKELINQNISVQAGLEMKFRDRPLVRYLAFAKHHLRRAINICQKDIEAGIFCLLTESDTHFTIWREQSLESQKVCVEATPKLHPQLNKSQLPRPQENGILSQIEEIELGCAASPPITDVNRFAAASRSLKSTVEGIDTSFQSETCRRQPALVASMTKTSKSKTTLSSIYSTPRSAFLALLNQQLTKHIGPSADYLINKLLAERPNIQPQQMIEAIVAEIPNAQEAQNIQKSLERLTHSFFKGEV